MIEKDRMIERRWKMVVVVELCLGFSVLSVV